MKRVVSLFVVLLVTTTAFQGRSASDSFDHRFDEYGRIRWEDEMARLDNFAIQLQNLSEKYVGYILVFDEAGGCAGEGQARAVRAKRYIVEHRGIPWNRVVFRTEGYFADFRTTLLIVPPGVTLPFPFHSYGRVPNNGPAPRGCKERLARIRRSRW